MKKRSFNRFYSEAITKDLYTPMLFRMTDQTKQIKYKKEGYEIILLSLNVFYGGRDRI